MTSAGAGRPGVPTVWGWENSRVRLPPFPGRRYVSTFAVLIACSPALGDPISLFTASGVNRPGDAQGPFAFAHDFTIGSTPVKVSALGFYDDGADGLTLAHNVALYNRANITTPVATVTVPAGTSASLVGTGTYSNGSGRQGGFRIISLAATLNLPAGFQGTIMSYGISSSPNKTDNYGDGGQGVNTGASINGGTAALTYLGMYYTATSATSGFFRANFVGGSGLAGGTIMFDVPEPAALAAGGMVAAASLTCRRRRARGRGDIAAT